MDFERNWFYWRKFTLFVGVYMLEQMHTSIFNRCILIENSLKFDAINLEMSIVYD